MLEGKELVKKLGPYGEASVDVTPELDIEISVAVKHKVELIPVLEAYVAKTPNKVDDGVLATVKNLLALLKVTK